MIKKNGYKIDYINKHSSDIVDKDGNYLMSFSIDHHSGSKDQVLLPYVKLFEKLTQKNEEQTDDK